MNSEKYWINRADDLIYHHMDDAEQAADEIATLYRKASKWLIYECKKIFERYQSTHNLTEAEARRLISQLQDPASLAELKRLLAQDGRNQDILARLDAPAYQYRIDRLQQIQNQLNIVMENVYQQEKITAGNFFVDLASESYYRQIYEIQHNTSYAFSFAHIDRKQIDKVISIPWSGKHYSERLWRNQKSLTKAIKEELLMNLVTGRTENEAAKIIANKFNQGMMEARRLIRTESAFVAGELNAEAYEECDLKKYRFVATLDLRTSEICRSLDGKQFFLKNRQVGKNYPPMHPWCRSTTIAYISEDELKNLKRRALNPETGRMELVPAYMTYEEWYKKYVQGKPKAEAQEKAIQNRASDRKQYERYKEILGNDMPGRFTDFQEMKYNDPEEWENLKEFKQYLEKNPGNTRQDYEVQKVLKESGIKGTAKVNPDKIDLTEYSYDTKHINTERAHKVSREETERFIKEADVSLTRWNGRFVNYYSKDGAAYVDVENKNIRTAFTSKEYDENTLKIREAVEKYAGENSDVPHTEKED